MRKIIVEVLERELKELNRLSINGGLTIDQITALDKLIKAYKTFADSSDIPPPADPANPQNQSTEDLLSDVLDEQVHASAEN